MKEKIAIIGGGITGLFLGYYLSSRHRVTIFEKEKILGGLTAGFKKPNWQYTLDNFYHHFFKNDQETIKLLKQLKIDYFFTRPKSSNYQNGQIHQFDSSLSLLTYPYLNFYQKLRAGGAIAALKILPQGKLLENKLATQFLPQLMGKKTYQILWEPLLRGKFGKNTNEISASWFWARIKKRTSRLGYIKGGFQNLINHLAQKIKENNGEIKTNFVVKNIDQLANFSKIIVTTPLPTFLKIAPNLPAKYKKQLRSIKTIGAINLILINQKPFLIDHTYWLNINDKRFPFVAVVDHTNFISSRFYGGNHILYVGGYYPSNHPFFKMNKEELLEKFLPYLQKINPHFNSSSIINYQLSKSLSAQPLVIPGYKNLIPSFQTPLANVYLANMEQIYPWDRGINYAITMAKRVVKMIK